MKNLRSVVLVTLLALGGSLFASASPAQVAGQTQGSGAPTNPCTSTATYLDITNHVFYNCSNGVWVNIGGTPGAQSGGGGGITSVPPGVLATTYTPFAGKVRWDCSWANLSPTITCPSGTFGASDVGKIAFATNQNPTGFTTFVSGATQCGTTSGAAATILTFTDSAHVNLSQNCTANSPTNAPFVWGPDETAGLTSAITAAANLCAAVVLPSGIAIVTTDPFINLPTTNCVNNNAAVRGGLTIRGQGQNASVIAFASNFDMTTCTLGGAATACIGSTGGASNGGYNLESLLLTAYGAQPASGSAKTILLMNAGGYLLNVACTGFSAAVANISGLVLGGIGPISVSQTQFDGCGSVPLTVNTAGFGIAEINHSYFGDGSSTAAVIGGYLESANNIYGGAVGSANTNAILLNATSTLQSTNDEFGNPGGSTTNNTTLALTNANAVANITNGLISTTPANGTAVFIGTSGAQLRLANTKVVASTAGSHALNIVAGGILNDLGGNSYTTTAANTLTGQVVNEANSANGVPVTAAKLVLSAGWGNTAAVTALTGGDAPIQFTVTNSGTGQGASPTIAYTFPTPYLVAPFSCTATQVGGTNATGTFTSSALSATAVTFTFSLTPTGSSTEIVQVTCVTP
jgi:hypothetical protein